MRKPVIAALILFALAGCSKSEEAKKAESGPIKREPGLWKSDLKLVRLDMPGAPKEVVDGMAAMMGRMKGLESCLTPEQSAKEDMAQALAKPPGDKGLCTFSKKDFSGGQVDVVMVCTDAASKEAMTISTKGTIAAKSSNVHMTMEGKQSGMPMSLEMEATNTWTGPCKS